MTKGPQRLVRRRIKHTAGLLRSHRHPSPSDTTVNPAATRHHRTCSNSRQHPGSGRAPGETRAPLTPAGSHRPARPIPPSGTAPASSAAASSAKRGLCFPPCQPCHRQQPARHPQCPARASPSACQRPRLADPADMPSASCGCCGRPASPAPGASPPVDAAVPIIGVSRLVPHPPRRDIRGFLIFS